MALVGLVALVTYGSCVPGGSCGPRGSCGPCHLWVMWIGEKSEIRQDHLCFNHISILVLKMIFVGID